MLKVLIVDNEEIICKGLSILIPWDEYGFDAPVFAFDGMEGLSKIRQDPYDLLITDLRMPGLDGIELCRETSKLRPDCEIIIISGYRDFQSAQLAFDYHVLGYLLKPIDGDKLASLVHQVAAKKSSAANNELQFYKSFSLSPESHKCGTAASSDELSHHLANGNTEASLECVRCFISDLFYQQPVLNTRLELCAGFLRPVENMLSEIDVSLSTFLTPSRTIQEYCTTDSLFSLSALLSSLVTNISRYITDRRMSRTQKTVNEICEFIQSHYNEKLTVSYLASCFHLTPAYLGRLFKNEKNINLHQFIHTCRIEKAKELITAGDLSLGYISEFVGYSDLSNFYYQFKKSTSFTPDQYRELYRRQDSLPETGDKQ